jgi:hypothetical protein
LGDSEGELFIMPWGEERCDWDPALPDLRWGPIAQTRVRSFGVVAMPVLFEQDLGLRE